MSDTPVPDGKITVFNKDQFDKMIKFVQGEYDNLNTGLLSPSGGVRLDTNTGATVLPGDLSWSPAKLYNGSAAALGTSVHEQLTAISDRWDEFTQQLVDAKTIFEKTGDLATLTASDFPLGSPGAPPTTK